MLNLVNVAFLPSLHTLYMFMLYVQNNVLISISFHFEIIVAITVKLFSFIVLLFLNKKKTTLQCYNVVSYTHENYKHVVLPLFNNLI